MAFVLGHDWACNPSNGCEEMIQLLEKERDQLRDLMQATSDIIQHFKNRRAIEAFDLYPITIINDGLAKWHNVAGFHIGFWVKSSKTYAKKLVNDVRVFLRSRSDDEVHDPTWWKRYKLHWHVEGNLIDISPNQGAGVRWKFWVQLRLKRRW
jgi:hypothetical protein